MRQGQHNNQHGKNRQRGRGGRRQGGGNPLNRVYESNGPDVKVRGTAQHVADKYLQLARDAQSSGHLVTAENLYQHAEHYLRIVAANQPASAQQGNSANNRRGAEADARTDGDEAPAKAAAQKSDTPPAEAKRGRPRQERERQEDAGAAKPEAKADDAGGADGGWDGPQPDFLRKPAAAESNGDARPKRTRRPAKSNGAAAPAPEAAEADANNAGAANADADADAAPKMTANAETASAETSSPCQPASQDQPDVSSDGEPAVS